jgi:hypothetical protein
VLFVLGVCGVSVRAAAAKPEHKPAAAADDSDDKPAAAADDSDDKPTPKRRKSVDKHALPADDAEDAAEDIDKPAPAAEKKPTSGSASEEAAIPEPSAPEEKAAEPEGWHTELHGYFRAPMALGFSSRPGPDDPNGANHTQVSYGPNRTVDASYYSFAYTRLQEQDWAEVTIHEKKKHVDAAVGWMGYWFQGVGYRDLDASWAPAIASVALDTDFDMGGVKPNVMLTMGAFWPSFGYFEKYDTYTLGRFRQMGEQVKLTVPVNPDLKLTLVHGLGSSRDGSYQTQVTPLYAGTTAIDLLTYANVDLAYQKAFNVGLHYNTEWTADPNLAKGTMPDDKSYQAVQKAHLTVIGAEANVRASGFGHLWISPSYIHVRNGWALANGGTEVMHSLSGVGIATNYLGWGDAPESSTGSGSLTNFGFTYENSLSNIQGKELGSVMPDVSFSVFGLVTSAKFDLPPGSDFPRSTLKQFKYGADVTLQALKWLGFMMRYDFVNYDTANDGFVFSAITPRVVFSSNFLSSERIYIQYSRYTYGDNMTLGAKWPVPWGQALVAGNDIIQNGPYAGKKPDQNVVKLQAEIAF